MTKEYKTTDLDQWLDELSKHRAKLETLDEQRKAINAKKEAVEKKLLAYMKDTGKTAYIGDGAKVELRQSLSYKLPKDDESKQAFFEYLKAKGEDVFFGLISVNSQTLNAFCKREHEWANENNIFPFGIAGVGDPTVYEKVIFKKLK